MIGCRIGRHRVPPPEAIVDNGALQVAACPRCRDELVRVGAAGWRAVPRGFRIVWRPRPAPIALPSPARTVPARGDASALMREFGGRMRVRVGDRLREGMAVDPARRPFPPAAAASARARV